MQNVPLSDLQFHDVAFLDEDRDPREEWLIASEEKNLDRYISRFLNGLKPVSGSDALRDRAEALRHRLHTVGINSATLLVAVGMK